MIRPSNWISFNPVFLPKIRVCNKEFRDPLRFWYQGVWWSGGVYIEIDWPAVVNGEVKIGIPILSSLLLAFTIWLIKRIYSALLQYLSALDASHLGCRLVFRMGTFDRSGQFSCVLYSSVLWPDKVFFPVRWSLFPVIGFSYC